MYLDNTDWLFLNVQQVVKGNPQTSGEFFSYVLEIGLAR